MQVIQHFLLMAQGDMKLQVPLQVMILFLLFPEME